VSDPTYDDAVPQTGTAKGVDPITVILAVLFAGVQLTWTSFLIWLALRLFL